MKIDYPAECQLPALRRLWKDTFGDSDAFLDGFYSVAFSPERCRCVSVRGEVAAALYWFDCQLQGKPVAYVYAVATDRAHRGKGYCRALMENLHGHLSCLGYAGAVLAPATQELVRMYEGFGYRVCSCASEQTVAAAQQPAALRKLEVAEFARLRRQYLPEGGVLQEGESLAFLQTMAGFYAGEDFLLTVALDSDGFFAPELLGNSSAAPAILAAFGEKEGRFRLPGGQKPFTMYHPLSTLAPPSYFGFVFD